MLTAKTETEARAEMERIGGQELYKLDEHDIWMCLTHAGLCICDYERNGYDDSDFHMIVWNPETKTTEDICFATTRGWTYPCYGSAADLTPDNEKEVREYIYNFSKQARLNHFEKEAKKIDWAKTVKVARGRKVPIGTVAEVFWYGANRFGGFSVGLRHVDGSRVFTDAKNVEVVNWESYLPVDREERASQWAEYQSQNLYAARGLAYMSAAL
jgi:hypothetical protein